MSATAAWLPRWHARHSHIMVALTCAVAAAGAPLTRAPIGVQVAGLAGAVAVLGVPHGALDTLVGRAVFAPRLGRWWGVAFYGAYLGVVGVVLLGWAVAPVTTLGTFLVVSALHFGDGDVSRDPQWHARWPRLSRAWSAAEVVARGALPVVAPATAFPTEVGRLFAWLVPGTARRGAEAMAHALAWAGPRILAPALAVIVVHHLVAALPSRASPRGSPGLHGAAHLAAAAEVVALAVIFVTAPPLVAFLVYFCGWHSVRHTLHLAARLDPRRPGRALVRFVRLGALASAAALVGGLVAWLGWWPKMGATPAAVRALFVGLSALTFPHMALTAYAGEEDGVRRIVRARDTRSQRVAGRLAGRPLRPLTPRLRSRIA